MSRVHFAFDNQQGRTSSRGAKSAVRRHLQKAMETAGLFAFGFGSTTLIMQLTAGLYLVSIARTLRPLLPL